MVDSPNSRCVTCNDRFFASDSSCLPVPQYCDGYNSVGKCTSCKQDLILQADGTCLAPPPTPQVQVATNQYNQNQAQITQAQQYGDQTQQIQSSNQFSQGASSSSQSSFQSNTQQSSSAGFVYGQTINQGTQQASGSNAMRGSDGNCREYFAGKCSKCSSRYYVGVEGRCVPVNPLCKDSNSVGECTACYPGYRVDSGSVLSHCPRMSTAKLSKANSAPNATKDFSTIKMIECAKSSILCARLPT